MPSEVDGKDCRVYLHSWILVRKFVFRTVMRSVSLRMRCRSTGNKVTKNLYGHSNRKTEFGCNSPGAMSPYPVLGVSSVC